MKIGLLGYGKMGREIEKMAVGRGHEITLTIDRPEEWEEKLNELKGVEMAIDFSTRDSVLDNIHRCFDAGVPLVIGTTGWHTHVQEIREECIDRGCSLFYSPNFSIGVNLFFELNKYLATQMSEWSGYEISLEETHHIHKQDAPSGTAIMLANDIIRLLGRKEKWVKEPAESSGDIGIRSVRMEDVTGTHKVIYESDEDLIEIVHTAKNRRGFSLGAILAAEWLLGKKGFFEMQDLFQSLKKGR
ncbi:MAG: 4-hydroxy-tetrahydrodipicolinate reductase [bacterium]